MFTVRVQGLACKIWLPAFLIAASCSCAASYPDANLVGLLLLPEDEAQASSSGPAISAISPADGSTGLAITGSDFSIAFSEAMDDATITFQTASGACDSSATVRLTSDNYASCIGISSFTKSGNSYQFTIAGPLFLEDNQTFHIAVKKGARSARGVNLAFDFNTSSGLRSFTPADIVDLRLWHKGYTAQFLQDGFGDALAWPDSSGNGMVGLGPLGNRPTYIASDALANNRNVLRFQGSKQIDYSGEPGDFNEPTLIWVARRDAAATGIIFHDRAPAGQFIRARILASADYEFEIDDGGGNTINATTGSSPATAYSMGVARLRMSGIPAVDLYVNGALMGSPSNALYNAATTWNAGNPPRLGRSAGGGPPEFLSGWIGEFMIYRRSLTLTEIQRLECYLSRKYSIAIGHGC